MGNNWKKVSMTKKIGKRSKTSNKTIKKSKTS
jgi:hypothetical protein